MNFCDKDIRNTWLFLICQIIWNWWLMDHVNPRNSRNSSISEIDEENFFSVRDPEHTKIPHTNSNLIIILNSYHSRIYSVPYKHVQYTHTKNSPRLCKQNSDDCFDDKTRGCNTTLGYYSYYLVKLVIVLWVTYTSFHSTATQTWAKLLNKNSLKIQQKCAVLCVFMLAVTSFAVLLKCFFWRGSFFSFFFTTFYFGSTNSKAMMSYFVNSL